VTKLSSRLPDIERNGLDHIAGQMVSTPHQTHVIIAVVDCVSTTTNFDTGAIIPTARIRRVEVIPPSSYRAAEPLMRESIEARNGQAFLPFEDLKGELEHAFRFTDVSFLREATGLHLHTGDDEP
jgi:hypothetical protein